MCLTPDDALALAVWMREVARAEEQVAVCRGAEMKTDLLPGEVDVAYAVPNGPVVPRVFGAGPLPHGLDQLRRALLYPVVEDTAVTVEVCTGKPGVWDPRNAWYDSSADAVLICAEFLAEARSRIGDRLVRGFAWWVLAHELAHAVMIRGDVPYTGSAETAADELAALWLVAYDRPHHAVAGAAFWEMRGGAEDHTDPHPGDMRRAWDTVCLVYGSDTLRHADVGVWLGIGRWRCPWRYQRALDAWTRLLAPLWRDA